ncbi:MAG: FkbM family methyltransferase [Bacteroidia bacterium]
MINRLIGRIIPSKIINTLRLKLGVPSQQASFLRLRKLGFDPKFILDIGAYEGNWAQDIHQVFPLAQIMMIEGQRSKKPILDLKSQSIPKSVVKIALLGAKEDEVEFNMYESASSVYKEDNKTNAKIETIKLQLLDNVIENSFFTKVDMIKIDTQGYELEILKGGTKALQAAQFVLLEISLLGIYKNAPLVDEVISFMKANNFMLYDICSIMRRPYDKALFQSDFLFIKADHPLRSSTRWN